MSDPQETEYATNSDERNQIPDGGWIKLHRSILCWEWWDDTNTFKLFIALILLANHAPAKWHGVTIQRGQLITGRRSLAKKTGLSEKSVRTSLERLKSTHEVAIETSHLFSIITICNYEKYQQRDEILVPPNGQLVAQQGPTPGQPLATNKKNKNKKNDKNINLLEPPSESPEKLNLAPRISMTKKQAADLVAEFGAESCAYYKKVCSDWLLENGKTKKDAAAFMRRWIRKEIAERRGFYYPKQNTNGYQPHTPANTAQKNLEYLEAQYGKEGVKGLLDVVIDNQKELSFERDDGGSLVPVVAGTTHRRGD